MAKFRLLSIKGGEETLENGNISIILGISATSVVKMAHNEWRSKVVKRQRWAEDMISGGWPSLPYLAVMKLVKGDYETDAVNDIVTVTVPEIPGE